MRLLFKLFTFFSFLLSTSFSFAQTDVLNFDGSLQTRVDIDNVVQTGTAFRNALNSGTFTIQFKMRAEDNLQGSVSGCGTSGAGSNPVMVAIADNVGNNRLLILMTPSGSGGGRLQIFENDNSRDVDSTAGTGGRIGEGNCHHIAYVSQSINGGNARRVVVYVDGQPAILPYTITNNLFTPGDNLLMSLGSDIDGAAPAGVCFDQFFTGDMDNISLWNDARTQTEIQNYMQGGPATATNLVVNYLVIDDAANQSQLIDYSGSNLDGTYDGFAGTFSRSCFVTQWDCAGGSTIPRNKSSKSLNSEDVEHGIVEYEKEREEIKDNISINIFPNPTTAEVTVKTLVKGVSTVMITDYSGLELIVKDFDGRSTLNLEELPTGIYFVTITDETGIRTEKFVKK